MDTEQFLDLQGTPANQQLSTLLTRFEQLKINDTIVLHNPDPALQDALHTELAGAYRWQEQQDGIHVTKTASTSLPRIVGNAAVTAESGGSAWKLEPAQRGLDANIIVLAPDDEIESHTGPTLDVVIVVLSGSGILETEAETIMLNEDTIVWLPKLSQRRFVAGPNGLRYFSVHTRKQGLSITSRPE